MLRLCQAELGVGEVDVAERDAVLGWLKGERVALALLRRSLIYGRIGRHSAQAMLTSLASWLPRVGHGGLVLDIDLARLAVGRRPPVEQREGVYYSKAAVLDAYEVLRQLIDATDVLSAAMVVACPPTARCTFASPMRCATVADPTRMPVWSDWKHGWRRWRSGDRVARSCG